MADLRRLLRLILAAMALLLASCLCPSAAQANVSCGSPTATLTFGTASTATGSVNWSCTNYGASPVSFTICTVMGTASYPGSTSAPVMINGAAQLRFDVYTNSGRTTLWSPTTMVTAAVTVPANGTLTGSLYVYGSITSGQSPTVGSYTGYFHNTPVGFVTGGTCQVNPAGGQLAGAQVSMTITATISSSCTVTAGSSSAIAFGNVLSTATNLTANSAISINCPSGTAYYVGLRPSNNNTAGAGVMSGTNGNSATIAYQLRSTSGIGGTVWGDTATSSSVGNGVGSTGTGSAQSRTVYATVPSVNDKPDTYSDTVTVTVNY